MEVQTKQKQLGQMVDELIKPLPDQNLVKNIGETLGIPYHEDIVAQMNAVLEYMHGSAVSEKPLKEKEMDN